MWKMKELNTERVGNLCKETQPSTKSWDSTRDLLDSTGTPLYYYAMLANVFFSRSNFLRSRPSGSFLQGIFSISFFYPVLFIGSYERTLLKCANLKTNHTEEPTAYINDSS